MNLSVKNFNSNFVNLKRRKERYPFTAFTDDLIKVRILIV